MVGKIKYYYLLKFQFGTRLHELHKLVIYGKLSCIEYNETPAPEGGLGLDKPACSVYHWSVGNVWECAAIVGCFVIKYEFVNMAQDPLYLNN